VRILDLFCGVGGAAVGYASAGHDVTGVDIARQPNYPYTFIRADALSYAFDHGHEYDVIHSSPPCQAYTTLLAGRAAQLQHPDLIPATRGMLNHLGIPWIMENVPGAIMRRDLVLCGAYFSLPIVRHRYFELGLMSVTQPPHLTHGEELISVYGSGGGYKGSLEDWKRAMGLPHAVTRRELANAIPPAYTRYIADNWTLAESRLDTHPFG
jgi:site-specific DNA-cytosine methylase